MKCLSLLGCVAVFAVPRAQRPTGLAPLAGPLAGRVSCRALVGKPHQMPRPALPQPEARVAAASGGAAGTVTGSGGAASGGANNFKRMTDQEWSSQINAATPADVPWMQDLVVR